MLFLASFLVIIIGFLVIAGFFSLALGGICWFLLFAIILFSPVGHFTADFGFCLFFSF
jgi:hypothetical protein